MKKIVLILLAIVSCLSVNVVEAATLKIKSLYGEITYKYDEKRISEKILRKYIEINPSYYNPRLLIAPQLELCIANDPRYYPCYSRDIHDKNFFKNSLVNINIAKESLQHLHELNEVKELKPLVDYFIDSLSFSLWLNESKYQFYQTWDTSHLKNAYKNLDPLKICPDIIQQIQNSNDINEKYKLAKKEWHNALNKKYRENINEDSLKKIWSDFLKHYQIEEKIITNATTYSEQQVSSFDFPPPAAELGPGQRAKCSCGTLQFHTGTDWVAKEGTAVPVADDGVVIRVEENEGAIVYSPTGGFCGRYVVVRHDYPNGHAVYTRYAQLGRLVGNNAEPIRVGTKVKKQDKIGEVGKFGLFHFEVRPVDSKTMDTGTWTKPYAEDKTMEWAKYPPVNPDTFDFDEFAKGNSEVTLDKGQSETLPESKKEVKSPEVQEEKKPHEINFADGSKYVGDTLDGKMHGQGTYIWPSGDKYVGEFQNNRATGGWFYRVNGTKLWIYQDSEGKWITKQQ